MTERMLEALARLDVRLIAVDEAHCISQWGPAFRREYEDLSRLRDIFPNVPIIALTATADESTRTDIAARLFAGRVETLVLGFDRPNIKLGIEAKQDSKRQLLNFVERHPGRSGIVYCLSRKKTEETAAFLERERRHRARLSCRHEQGGARRQSEQLHDPVRRRHGGDHRLRHGHRQAGCRLCLPHRSAGQPRGLLPGNRACRPRRAGGRGAYAVRPRRYPHAADVHRRRGRAGGAQEARAWPARHADRLLRDGAVPPPDAAWLFRRGSVALRQLRQLPRPGAARDGAAEARIILAAMAQSGERFGAAHVIDILLGHETEKMLARSHHRLASFGSGRRTRRMSGCR